jgi:hypothetical protein
MNKIYVNSGGLDRSGRRLITVSRTSNPRKYVDFLYTANYDEYSSIYDEHCYYETKPLLSDCEIVWNSPSVEEILTCPVPILRLVAATFVRQSTKGGQ